MSKMKLKMIVREKVPSQRTRKKRVINKILRNSARHKGLKM